MTLEEYKELVDYLVEHSKPELEDILKAQTQFIEGTDTNVLQDNFLGIPVIKRLCTQGGITEEELQWIGLAYTSILVIGHCIEHCVDSEQSDGGK